MTPFIQNVSYADLVKGFHHNPYHNSVSIQIVDPAMEFPVPKHQFLETYKFEFLDLEERDGWGEEFKITRQQAKDIVGILQHALDNNLNVIVNCVAGVCRSGAVAEVGVMLGFRDTEVFRSPNLMVKHYLMRELGWTYDSDEPFSENGRHYFYDALNVKRYYDEIESGGDYGG